MHNKLNPENQIFYCIPKPDWAITRVIEPNFETGPWIAGGSVLQWYQGLNVDSHDIDIFFASQSQMETFETELLNKCQFHHDSGSNKLQKKVKKAKYEALFSDPPKDIISIQTVYMTENAHTYSVDIGYTNYKVQLIKKYYPKSLEDLLNNFDISVCRIATDFLKFRASPEAIVDIKHKRLNFPHGLRPDSLKRIVKYYSYGFTPDPDLWEQALNVPGVVLKFEATGDYDHAF